MGLERDGRADRKKRKPKTNEAVKRKRELTGVLKGGSRAGGRKRLLFTTSPKEVVMS